MRECEREWEREGEREREDEREVTQRMSVINSLGKFDESKLGQLINY